MRRPPVAPPPLAVRVRVGRALAGVVVAVVAAAVVAGLGLLGGEATHWRHAEASTSSAPGGVSVVTVSTETTVWDVARDVAPAASEQELDAVVERIVTANSLTSVQLRPGQVLRVPAG